MKQLPLMLIAMLAFVLPAASAQTPQTATPGSAMSVAPGVATATEGKADAAIGDKSCIAARHKLEREQKSLERAQAEVARDAKLQQGCATKSVCARYAAALESLAKRIARHQRRIDNFTANRNHACKPG